MLTIIKTIIGLAILSCLFWIAFKITGALLAAIVWLVFKVPAGVILMVIGILLCCTVIGIPLGRKIFKAGGKLFVPG